MKSQELSQEFSVPLCSNAQLFDPGAIPGVISGAISECGISFASRIFRFQIVAGRALKMNRHMAALLLLAAKFPAICYQIACQETAAP
ncbi:hypothetical protein LP415_13615 [Polaromonas sp. P1(28)-8]|nr:hypothetical protein LP415_13615 [Polaromonas sp. P1(28)-8]